MTLTLLVLDLGLPSLQTVRNKFLLFISFQTDLMMTSITLRTKGIGQK